MIAQPSIAEQVRREAEQSSRARTAAASIGQSHETVLDARSVRARHEMRLADEFQALGVDSPMEAARVLREAWGPIWSAVIDHARARGERPVPAMVALIQAGLAGQNGQGAGA